MLLWKSKLNYFFKHSLVQVNHAFQMCVVVILISSGSRLILAILYRTADNKQGTCETLENPTRAEEVFCGTLCKECPRCLCALSLKHCRFCGKQKYDLLSVKKQIMDAQNKKSYFSLH